MSRRNASRNPLDGVPQWQQPQHQAAATPEPVEQDLAAGLFDPVARRAVSIVSRRYRARPGTEQWTEFHDRQALAIRRQLMSGTPLHEVDPTPRSTYTPPEQRQLMPIRYGPSWL